MEAADAAGPRNLGMVSEEEACATNALNKAFGNAKLTDLPKEIHLSKDIVASLRIAICILDSQFPFLVRKIKYIQLRLNISIHSHSQGFFASP